MDEWKKIIRRGHESKELDYKGPCEWNERDKAACCQIIKDILAMANTEGGWIVIGVTENATGWLFEGLSEQEIKSFESTRLNQFLQNYADPPINCKIIKKEDEGKNFVIIDVPQFKDTPHICQKDYPNILSSPTIYVRTDKNSSEPVKNSKDLRDIVENSIRNRSDKLLTSIRSIIIHGASESRETDSEKFSNEISEAIQRCNEVNPHLAERYGYRETSFYPAIYIADRFDIPELREMAEKASVDFRGWPFLFFSHRRTDAINNIARGVEAILLDPGLSGEDSLHYWRIYQSGLLYINELLHEDAFLRKKGIKPFLDFESMSKYTAEAITCLVRFFENVLDEDDDIVLRFKLTGIKGMPIGSLNWRRDIRPVHVCHENELMYEKTRSLIDWKTGLMDHALEMCRFFFLRFNWNLPNLNEPRKIIEAMLARRR